MTRLGFPLLVPPSVAFNACIYVTWVKAKAVDSFHPSGFPGIIFSYFPSACCRNLWNGGKEALELSAAPKRLQAPRSAFAAVVPIKPPSGPSQAPANAGAGGSGQGTFLPKSALRKLMVH